jgi:hypothetical protein
VDVQVLLRFAARVQAGRLPLLTRAASLWRQGESRLTDRTSGATFKQIRQPRTANPVPAQRAEPGPCRAGIRLAKNGVFEVSRTVDESETATVGALPPVFPWS